MSYKVVSDNNSEEMSENEAKKSQERTNIQPESYGAPSQAPFPFTNFFQGAGQKSENRNMTYVSNKKKANWSSPK